MTKPIKAIKALLFATHPSQFNGYSKVVYELAKCMAMPERCTDVEFSIYGFQNFHENPNHRKDLPSNVKVHDAFAVENPKAMGFGITGVREYVKENKPDVCIIYNDMMVLHQVITQLQLVRNEDKIPFKIIAYIDQVYLNQKKEFIDFINKNADHAMMFTSFWEKNILDQGITLPSSYLVHGFNKDTYFPIPKKLARMYYGLKNEDFIILNLNRNQPRKRWDTCIKAFAEIVSRYPNEPIKLMIATALQGAWNLIEIYERELKKRNVTLDAGMKHLIVIDNPQRITDAETNILYNVADIGINCADGEGYGLVQFESTAIGIPQIVPRLGGFMEYLDDDCAILIDPKMAYYVDNTRDMVCGEALLIEYMDVVEAIETYYFQSDARERHGKVGRKRICDQYGWNTITDKLVGIIKQVHGVAEVTVADVANKRQVIPVYTDSDDEVEAIDINDLMKLIPDAVVADVPSPTPTLPTTPTVQTPTTVSTTTPPTLVAVTTIQTQSDEEKSKRKKKEREMHRLQKKLDAIKNQIV